MQTPGRTVPVGKFRFWLGLGLFVLFFVGAAASTGPGITWDEPDYVAGGYSQVLWLGHLSARSFTREGIDEYWAINREHPPAAKWAYGTAGAIERGDTLTALLTARYLAVMMFVVLVGLVYLFVAGRFGRPAGVIAALSLVLIPRVFGHGLLAALDVPVALACFATTLVFSRAHTSTWRAVGAGVLWGVALLTKINAVFLPVVLIPWALWVYRKRAIVPCVALVVLGCLTFVAGWPWLWHNTGERIQRYAVNKVERIEGKGSQAGTTNVPVYYMGRTYRDKFAPWHYPIVMLLVTVPVGVLVFSGIGIRASMADKERRAVGVLVLASGLLHVLVFALPMVPKYDGIRLFMPAFPFLACLAGIGGAQVWRWRGHVGRIIVAAVLVINAAVLFWTHPYELSYYNCLVGGACGANRLGFETTYWGDTVNPGVMEFVNERCPDGSTVAVRPQYQEDILPWVKGELRWLEDWEPGRPPPDFLIVFPRHGYLDDFTKDLIRTHKPVRQWTYMGVPQCMLFDLR